VKATLIVLVAVLTVVPGAAAKQKAYVDRAGQCHTKSPCYTTIEAAVDRSAAGSTVVVFAGTYREHVVLREPLTLRGRPGATIDGGGSGTVLSLAASQATVSGLALRKGAVGIGLEGGDGNRLSSLRIARVRRGLFFSSEATGNLVTDTDVSQASEFAIDVGDQGSADNRFLRLTLRDSAKGFNAYSGSDRLLLEDSSLRGIGPGPAVTIGWSDGWTIADNEIVGNASGILTDTVGSGEIDHNYIARNAGDGIYEAGLYSTLSTHDNRIDGNRRSGISLCIGARNNEVRHNVVVGNVRHGIEICAHPSPQYFNTGNTVTGNYLFGPGGERGADARDDQGSNMWVRNYYAANRPWAAPFPIPGAAGAEDASPLLPRDLPQPGGGAACAGDGWWLLTNGSRPFRSRNECLKFTGSPPTVDRDCADFPNQRAAQIFFLEQGGPQRDPHHLDGNRDGIACEGNPCPCYHGTGLPPGRPRLFHLAEVVDLRMPRRARPSTMSAWRKAASPRLPPPSPAAPGRRR
jgi:nitrous oxidase accessory protein NosD